MILTLVGTPDPDPTPAVREPVTELCDLSRELEALAARAAALLGVLRALDATKAEAAS